VVGRGPASPWGRDTLYQTGRETFRLEGQVVDQDERPVGGASVNLISASGLATTETDGSFSFENLAARSYTVVATKGNLIGDGGIDLSNETDPLVITVHAGPTVVIRAVDADGAGPIAGAVVKSWGRTGITDVDGVARIVGVSASNPRFDIAAIGYEPNTIEVRPSDDPATVVTRIVELHRGARLVGSVIGPDGLTVADAEVTVQSVNTGWSGAAKTNASGTWHFDAVAAGKHLLTATSEIYGSEPAETVETDGAALRDGIVVHVAYDGQLVGTVVDGGGKTVPYARVTAIREEGQGYGGSFDTITAKNGRFSILGIPFGAYSIWARDTKRGSMRATVNLVKEERVEVRLVLEDSSIMGVVVNSRGTPVSNVRVGASMESSPGQPSVLTDKRGTFDLGGMPPGQYYVRGYTDDGASTESILTGTRSPPLRLLLRDPAAIIGRVLLDGSPVTYFGLMVTQTPEDRWTEHPHPIRSPDGRFSQTELAIGTWSVIISGSSDFQVG
jgi:hypothetical protein